MVQKLFGCYEPGLSMSLFCSTLFLSIPVKFPGPTTKQWCSVSQMEVKQAGQSSMLANPAKLASIAPKINKLAAREFEAGPPILLVYLLLLLTRWLHCLPEREVACILARLR